MATARYRGHVDAPRSCQVRLRFTPAELEAVTAAADRAQLTPSGYAAETAVAAALRLAAPSPTPWDDGLTELALTRSQLRRIGANLNQAARILNVDGVAPIWLERACWIVQRSVSRLDAATAEVHHLARRRTSPRPPGTDEVPAV